MTAAFVESLRDFLCQMRERDTEFHVHGSILHKYRLGPPLSENELQAFERRHHIVLPADYRFFLKNVGDGGAIRSDAPIVAVNAGAGPGCGLLPLEEAAEECDPGRPFPLVASVEAQPFRGIERWGDGEVYPGVLQLCYAGSAGYDFLVVNGPAYSTMWGADVDIRNFTPVAPSFEVWYRRWMDRLTDTVLSRAQ
jgi:hypothetical protein